MIIRLLTIIITFTLYFSAHAEINVKIGVRAHTGSQLAIERWQPTADYLSQKINDYHFEIIPFEKISAMDEAVRKDELDFVITQPVSYVDLSVKYDVISMLTLVKPGNITQFSSIIITRADRDDINTLKDLRNKDFGAVDPKGFGGWLMAKRELLHQGINPDTDFNNLHFLVFQQSVVEAILRGLIDAGTVRTGILEQLEKKGQIKQSDFKILNAKTNNKFPYTYSTELYPEWVFARTSHADIELAERVLKLLIDIPPQSEITRKGRYEDWTLALDYQQVHELMKELHVGSYKDIYNFDFASIVKRYRYWLLLSLVLMLTVIFFLLKSMYLNQKLAVQIKDKQTLINKINERQEELEKANITLEQEIKTRIQLEEDLKHREQSLLDSHETLLEAQRIAKLGNWILNHKTSELTWSDEIYKIFELDKDKFIPNYDSFLNTIHPEDRDMVNIAYLKSLEDQSDYDITHRLLIDDNKIKYVHENCHTEFDSLGKPIRSSGTVQDLTEQVLQNEQLRHSQKMNALGKLTGGIAHDYNNILGVIIGYVEMLQLTNAVNEGATNYLEEILTAARRATNLTQKLLDFSRYKTTLNQSLFLHEKILDQKNVLERTITSRINLVLDLKDTWPVSIDLDDLHNAILNICINSMHAIEDTGTIRIKSRDLHLDKAPASVLSLEEGDYIELCVIDDGSGMDQATQLHAFDPFFSTKHEDGTGLGLSQVYGFIQRSGGNIDLHSSLGNGTTICLYFPRDNSGTRQNNANHQQALNEKLHGTETILVVDDEVALASIASEQLKNQGYKVLTAYSAEEAISTLENNEIDLLYSDVIMPDINGYDLAKTVLDRWPGIKIQLTSGYSTDEIWEEKYHHWKEHLLQKPVDCKLLISTIRNRLDEKAT